MAVNYRTDDALSIGGRTRTLLVDRDIGSGERDGDPSGAGRGSGGVDAVAPAEVGGAVVDALERLTRTLDVDFRRASRQFTLLPGLGNSFGDDDAAIRVPMALDPLRRLCADQQLALNELHRLAGTNADDEREASTAFARYARLSRFLVPLLWGSNSESEATRVIRGADAQRRELAMPLSAAVPARFSGRWVEGRTTEHLGDDAAANDDRLQRDLKDCRGLVLCFALAWLRSILSLRARISAEGETSGTSERERVALDLAAFLALEDLSKLSKGEGLRLRGNVDSAGVIEEVRRYVELASHHTARAGGALVDLRESGNGPPLVSGRGHATASAAWTREQGEGDREHAVRIVLASASTAAMQCGVSTVDLAVVERALSSSLTRVLQADDELATVLPATADTLGADAGSEERARCGLELIGALQLRRLALSLSRDERRGVVEIVDAALDDRPLQRTLDDCTRSELEAWTALRSSRARVDEQGGLAGSRRSDAVRYSTFGRDRSVDGVSLAGGLDDAASEASFLAASRDDETLRYDERAVRDGGSYFGDGEDERGGMVGEDDGLLDDRSESRWTERDIESNGELAAMPPPPDWPETPVHEASMDEDLDGVSTTRDSQRTTDRASLLPRAMSGGVALRGRLDEDDDDGPAALRQAAPDHVSYRSGSTTTAGSAFRPATGDAHSLHDVPFFDGSWEIGRTAAGEEMQGTGGERGDDDPYGVYEDADDVSFAIQREWPESTYAGHEHDRIEPDDEDEYSSYRSVSNDSVARGKAKVLHWHATPSARWSAAASNAAATTTGAHDTAATAPSAVDASEVREVLHRVVEQRDENERQRDKFQRLFAENHRLIRWQDRQVHELGESLQEHQRERALQRETIERLQAESEASETERGLLAARASQLAAEKDRLETALKESAQREALVLEAERGQSEAALRETEERTAARALSEIQAVRAAKTEVEVALRDSTARIFELERALEESAAASTILRAEGEEAVRRMTTAEAAVEELGNRLAANALEVEERLAAAARELHASRAERDDALQRSAIADELSSQLRAANEDLRAAGERAAASSAEFEGECERLRTELSQTRRTLDASRDAAEILKDQLQEQRSAADDLSRSADDAARELESSKKSLESSRTRERRLGERNEELDRRLAEAEEKTRALEPVRSERDRLVEASARSKAEMEELRRAAVAARDDAEKAKKKIRESKNELKRVDAANKEAENEALQRIETLQREADESKRRLAEASQERRIAERDLRDELQRQKEMENRARSEVAVHRKRASELQARLEEAQARDAERASVNSRLTETVTDLQRRATEGRRVAEEDALRIASQKARLEEFEALLQTATGDNAALQATLEATALTAARDRALGEEEVQRLTVRLEEAESEKVAGEEAAIRELQERLTRAENSASAARAERAAASDEANRLASLVQRIENRAREKDDELREERRRVEQWSERATFLEESAVRREAETREENEAVDAREAHLLADLTNERTRAERLAARLRQKEQELQEARENERVESERVAALEERSIRLQLEVRAQREENERRETELRAAIEREKTSRDAAERRATESEALASASKEDSTRWREMVERSKLETAAALHLAESRERERERESEHWQRQNRALDEEMRGLAEELE